MFSLLLLIGARARAIVTEILTYKFKVRDFSFDFDKEISFDNLYQYLKLVSEHTYSEYSDNMTIPKVQIECTEYMENQIQNGISAKIKLDICLHGWQELKGIYTSFEPLHHDLVHFITKNKYSTTK